MRRWAGLLLLLFAGGIACQKSTTTAAEEPRQRLKRDLTWLARPRPPGSGAWQRSVIAWNVTNTAAAPT